MPRTKKAWSKPELIVLVRGRREEGVLDACKHDLGTTGPNTKCFNMGFWCSAEVAS